MSEFITVMVLNCGGKIQTQMKSLQLVNRSLSGDYPKVDADLTCGQSGTQSLLRITFILWYIMVINNSSLSLKGCGPQNKSASEISIRECEPHSQPYTHTYTSPRIFLCSVATRAGTELNLLLLSAVFIVWVSFILFLV